MSQLWDGHEKFLGPVQIMAPSSTCTPPTLAAAAAFFGADYHQSCLLVTVSGRESMAVSEVGGVESSMRVPNPAMVGINKQAWGGSGLS